MGSKAHIAVIGAGVFGAWTAHHLLAAGHRVTLVDAHGPAHARASSGGESRLTRAGYGKDAIYTRMAHDSLAQWKTLSAVSGLPIFHPHSDLWSDDFAAEPLHRQGLFIHEMTHVWQSQRRGRFYLPLMRHPFCRYSYKLTDGRPFERYGLEQQAEIVRHAFLAERGGAPPTRCPPGLIPFWPTKPA